MILAYNSVSQDTVTQNSIRTELFWFRFLRHSLTVFVRLPVRRITQKAVDEFSQNMANGQAMDNKICD